MDNEVISCFSRLMLMHNLCFCFMIYALYYVFTWTWFFMIINQSNSLEEINYNQASLTMHPRTFSERYLWNANLAFVYNIIYARVLHQPRFMSVFFTGSERVWHQATNFIFRPRTLIMSRKQITGGGELIKGLRSVFILNLGNRINDYTIII